MAGPIKISLIADAQAATRGAGDFGKAIKKETEDTASGLSHLGDKADASEQRILGLKDTVDGAATVMQGPGKVGLAAYIQGWADLASGLANFVVPALASMSKATITSGIATVRSTAATVASRAAQLASSAATTVWTGAQWLLNAALTANPIGIVIVAIVALVAAVVIAYKRSETFRRIVDAAFRGVLAAARAVWGWIKGNWPLLLAIITGPIGIAVRLITGHFNTIRTRILGIPKVIRGVFASAGTWLVGAGRNIITGLWNGINALKGWLISKVRSFIDNTVPGPIRRALGISSPSRVARSLGQFVGMGLGMGLDDTVARVQRSAGRLAGASIAGPSSSGTAAPSGSGGGFLEVRAAPGATSDLDAFLIELVRRFVRVRFGGDVQAALGR